MKKSIEELLEQSATTEPPRMPAIFNDTRLEDAFKSPECNESGYAKNSMPAIWGDSFSFGQKPNGVKILSLKSASISSNKYNKYLDESALVWNAIKNEIYIYLPDAKCPEMAFKGTAWGCAKKLKKEYSGISLEDMIYEYQQ